MHLAQHELGSFVIIIVIIIIMTVFNNNIILTIVIIIIVIVIIPMAKLVSTLAGILRRTSIELGSGTVSFDVSLLSDLTGQQRAIMTNLQVYICYSLCLSQVTQVAQQVRAVGSCDCQRGLPLAMHCGC